MKKNKFATIMLAVIALSAFAFAGCGKNEARATESTGYANQQQAGGEELEESSQDGEIPQINGQDIQMGGSTMTFEEFMIGMKDDLSPEVMEELKEIYEEWVEAEAEGDSDKIIELYETLEDMGVLTMEEQAPMYGFKTKP